MVTHGLFVERLFEIKWNEIVAFLTVDEVIAAAKLLALIVRSPPRQFGTVLIIRTLSNKIGFRFHHLHTGGIERPVALGTNRIHV